MVKQLFSGISTMLSSSSLETKTIQQQQQQQKTQKHLLSFLYIKKSLETYRNQLFFKQMLLHTKHENFISIQHLHSETMILRTKTDNVVHMIFSWRSRINKARFQRNAH